MGHDPNELAGLTFETVAHSESQATSKEMGEKGGVSSLLSTTMNTANRSSTVDSMDVDEIFADEAHAAGMQQLPLTSSAVEPK
jgi:hypothetical protein